MNNQFFWLTLNKQQKEAVFCDEYPLIKVIAGAGSGKTTVLVERLIYIKEQLNVSFSSILCIAYNTRAVKNLQSKIKKRLNIAANITLSNIATFHSFCLNHVLRAYFKDKTVTVLDDDVLTLSSVKKQAVDEEFVNFIKKTGLFYDKEILKEQDVKDQFEKLLIEYYDYFYDHCHQKLDDLFASKNFFVKSWPDVEQVLFGLNFVYFKKKFHASIYEISVDYFDIILLSKLILERNLLFCKNLTKRFPYILVDEFQDIDEIQYKILELLIKTQNIRSLFVVGDPDQCIYEWRRANVDILQSLIDRNYQKDHIKIIILSQNYRSGENILNYANSLIEFNKNRFKKILFSKIKNGKVFFQHFLAYEDEFLYVSERVQELLKTNNVLPKDIICLTRANKSITFLEKYLIEKKIPYQIFRANNFLNLKIIKSAIYCLLFMAKKSKLYFAKMLEIRALPLKIGEKTIIKIINSRLEIDDLFWNLDNLKMIFQTQQIKLLNHFYLVWQEYLKKSEKLPTREVLYQLFKDLNFFQYATADQMKNLNIFIEELISFNVPYYNLNKIVDYIENFFVSGIDSKSDDESKITLSTIHQAKGLEFGTVFLFHMTATAFHMKKLRPVEEERRIIFVALTRAKEQLFITSSNARNSSFYNTFYEKDEHNPFIAEMRACESEK